ncbi:MAG: LuxR C-terminal-related transcriptional regulator [Planctomycetes bacterium]|nr:LuxR C-terminal-related transcriptional regulator [Planctomycetota bacterium]
MKVVVHILAPTCAGDSGWIQSLFAQSDATVVVHQSLDECLRALEHDVEAGRAILISLGTDLSSGIELLQGLASKAIRIPIIFHSASFESFGASALENQRSTLRWANAIISLLPLNGRASDSEPKKLRVDRAAQNGALARLHTLTKREREVLEQILAGNSAKQIAIDQKVAHQTVLKHRGSIFRKFEVKGIVQLLRILPSSGDGQVG